jgi:hypothetical protein
MKRLFPLRRLSRFRTGRTKTTIGQVQLAEDLLATTTWCCASPVLHDRHLDKGIGAEPSEAQREGSSDELSRVVAVIEVLHHL